MVDLIPIGDFLLYPGRREVRRGDTLVHLSPKAFDLLAVLVARRPDAVSKAELKKHLWPDTTVVEANLANLVAEVRRALQDDAERPRLVRTVPRFGYAWCGNGPERAREGMTRRFRLEGAGSSVDLSPGENLLGRHPDSVLALSDDSVSRRHAMIRIEGDEAVLEDLGSKNGSTARGAPVREPTLLRDGDPICLGSVLLVVRIVGADASTRTTPPSAER